jgi:hypothetical protein
MTALEKAARQALDALKLHGEQYPHMVKGYCFDAITVLEDALAQQAEPVVEPVTEAVEPVDIKALAAKAGLPMAWISENGVIQWSQLERLVALAFPLHSSAKQAEPVQVEPVADAVLAEREACAQLCADYTEWCRQWGQDSNHTAAEAAAEECADAIRARGQQAEPVSLDAKIVHFAKTALHEMPRPATDWHHCAKRVCEAVVATNAQQAEPPMYRLAETDIYDFAGWLTTRPGLMEVGESYEAGPMAEAVGEYLRTYPERFSPRKIEDE